MIRGDPEIEARINSYELAYKMQSSVPEAEMDISKEPKDIQEMYGTEPERHLCQQLPPGPTAGERGGALHSVVSSGWDKHANWSAKSSASARRPIKPVPR